MTLTASLNTALTGLNAAQRGMSVVSDNVSNVNTEGYARKEVVQRAVTLGGVGAGVSAEEIRRVTDDFLVRELRLSQSDFGRFEAMGRLHDQAVAMLGDPTGDEHIGALFDRVIETAGTLASNPETTAVRSNMTETLRRFTEDLDRLADNVSDLRRQADQRISETVSDVNRLLSDAHELNQRIRAETSATGRSGLVELRDNKLNELSKLIDLQVTPQSDEQVLVSTTAGLPLLDSSVRQLTHTGLAANTVGHAFEPLGINRIDSITDNVQSVSTNIDNRILSGELRGLLQMRDADLNDLATEIGAFAASAIEGLNAVHNSFTAVPPPATLTGPDLGTLATDPHSFSGIASFHAFDADNAIIATATIDFGAIGGTMGDVIAAVNAGLGGSGTLALTDGAVSFTAAGAATGVAIAQDATTPSDANGRGFAHRFGLNNLIETSSGPQFQTGVSGTTSHGFTGTIELQMIGPENQRPTTSTIDMGAIGGTFGDLINQLNTDFTNIASFNLDSAGALTVTPQNGFQGFRLEPTADGTQRGTSDASVSSFLGIGSGVRGSVALGAAVRTDILNNPNQLALASVDAAGTPAVFSGDNAGAVAMQSLSFETQSFDAAGRLPSMTATISEIGSELLGRAGQAAQDVDVRGQDREALFNDLSQRVSEVSGVNIDEEMAQLIQLQTAFNAATRVISATNEMLDALFRI